MINRILDKIVGKQKVSEGEQKLLEELGKEEDYELQTKVSQEFFYFL